MDGYTLLHDLRETLNEDENGSFLNDRVSYGFLYEGACHITVRLAALTAEDTLTTVASQSEYNLTPYYMGLYLKDKDGNFFVKYTDSSSNDYFITFQEYEELYYQNNTEEADIPYRFTIKDATTAVSRITGTASATGATTNGEATLTDTSTSTRFSTVSQGDIVHNTTSGYHGIVIEKTSNTALVTAMFDSSGDAQGWTSSDAYIINPKGRFSLIVDPLSSTAGDTITVPYIKKPTPVFSPYRSYPFPVDVTNELVQYAAFKYKNRDREPSFANTFFAWFDRELRVKARTVKGALNRGGFKMHMKGNR